MNPAVESLSPVYATVIVSTIFAVIWGLIFKDMLEYQVNQWYSHRETQLSIHYQKPSILITYLCLTLLVLISVGTSFATIGFSIRFALGMGAVVVIPTAILIWLQLGSMLQLLVSGGSEAVDIDSYGAGKKFDVQASRQD